MRNKWFIIFLLSALSSVAFAQSTFEIAIDGGWSMWGYTVNSPAKHTTSFSYGAHVGYAYFFTPHFGLGIGADFRRHGDALTLTTIQSWEDVTDTDGEHYNHHLAINKWRERQRAFYVSIPISIQFRIPTRSVDIYLMAGASYDIALNGHTSAQGTLTHTGDYPQWNMHVDDDVHAYGFYSTDDYKPSGKLSMKNTASAFIRADINIPINNRWYFFTGLIARYTFLPAYTQPEQVVSGFRDDSPVGPEAHPFMPTYEPMINTELVSGSFHPVTVGVEIGIRYVFPKRKNKYPCKCI